ncbi:MAG: L,D-transpeptidase family protein [Methyloceanibacter sp.]|uniref:L,D-transpeptidase family protein n=1 Tax=Methyloceanibacter sp. TaxID=1965321 RepID=UPI003EDE7D0F
MRMMGDGAANAAKRTLSTLSVFVGAAALAATAAVAPANSEEPAADANQPMTIVVSLGNQKADIYRGTTLITSTSVSTGKRGYSTKAGVFSILEKRRRHYSNLYNGAPMPWMQRLTWSGTALHAGVVPGYPASHGCIRLPYSFAPKLFSMTDVGGQVVIARSRVKPQLVEHPALLQPLPLPSPPTLVKQEDIPPATMRRSSNDAVPASKTRLPVVFAKAEAIEPQAVSETKIAAPFAVHAEASAPTQHPVAVAMLEDTREHAIDPNAVPPLDRGLHAAAKPAANAEDKRAAVEASEDSAKQQDRLAAPADAPAVPLSQVVSLASSTVAQPAAVVAMGVPEPQQTEEPKAGPILTVSASALTPPAVEPVLLSLAIMGLNDHPPLPPEKPSVMAAKLVAGAAAAAVEAAEPRSPEPLRILITRRTNRDGLRDAQYMLASLGYLEPQNFDGTFGTLTARAIKAFQEANDLPQTGAFTDDVEKKIYAAAGKEEPPQGHLFVRQKFASVLDVPVSFRNPDEPLGTHVFTVMHFEQGATKAQWMGINLNDGEDPTAVLDRIEIPDELRRNLSERLTPGSSMILADTAINSATLPKGADFLVWDSSKPAKVERASVSPAPVKKRRAATRRRVTTPTYTRRTERRNPWPF